MCIALAVHAVVTQVAACLMTAALAGQVMLVWPHQMYLTGITAGCILMVASGWFNIWSMWILVIFYLERKDKMVSAFVVFMCTENL